MKNETRRIAPVSVTIEEAGGQFAVFPSNSEISRLNAGTDFTSLDRRHIRAETKALGAQALSLCADAGAAVSLQPGVRGMRQNSISTPYSEKGIDARRML